jgi:hypothetical protein
MRIAVTPVEADAPLIIDSNAVGPSAVAFEQFKLISRRHAKVRKSHCPMQVQELSPRRPLDGSKSPDHLVLEQGLGV